MKWRWLQCQRGGDDVAYACARLGFDLGEPKFAARRGSGKCRFHRQIPATLAADWLFFDPPPVAIDPTGDGLVVALLGLTFGFLNCESQRFHNTRNVIDMIGHSVLSTDQLLDARTCPQVREESLRDRPLQQPLDQATALYCGQPRPLARSFLHAQAGLSAPPKSTLPTTDCPRIHAELGCNLRGTQPSLHQSQRTATLAEPFFRSAWCFHAVTYTKIRT